MCPAPSARAGRTSESTVNDTAGPPQDDEPRPDLPAAAPFVEAPRTPDSPHSALDLRAAGQGRDPGTAALPGKDDPVGLLERMRALHELTVKNTSLFAASRLFRIFLVLVDCLPVLVTLMGGRAVRAETKSGSTTHVRTPG